MSAWSDARIVSLTAAISQLADTDYITASELADKLRRLDLSVLADRLTQFATETTSTEGEQ